MFFRKKFDYKRTGQLAGLMVFRQPNGYWYWEALNNDLPFGRSPRGFKTETDAYKHGCSVNYLDTEVRDFYENRALLIVGVALLATLLLHLYIDMPFGG